MASPSLFQPRDGVGFDRYDDHFLICRFLSSPIMGIGLEEGKMSLSSFFYVQKMSSSESRRAGLCFFLSLSFSFCAPSAWSRSRGGRSAPAFGQMMMFLSRVGSTSGNFLTHAISLSLSLSLSP